MATINTPAARPNQPARQIIASFADYADAERAVDKLSDNGFPVNRVAIVGRDLEWVEQIRGRLTAGGAALRGAASGALVGALIGWVFGLLNWIDPLTTSLLLAVYGALFGGVVGALVGLLGHALQRGRRDFDAASSLVPRSYDVVADVEVADQALRLLSSANNPKE
jgi:hypothetical protein